MDVIQSSWACFPTGLTRGQIGKKEKIHPGSFGPFSIGSDSDSHLLRIEDAKELSGTNINSVENWSRV